MTESLKRPRLPVPAGLGASPAPVRGITSAPAERKCPAGPVPQPNRPGRRPLQATCASARPRGARPRSIPGRVHTSSHALEPRRYLSSEINASCSPPHFPTRQRHNQGQLYITHALTSCWTQTHLRFTYFREIHKHKNRDTASHINTEVMLNSNLRKDRFMHHQSITSAPTHPYWIQVIVAILSTYPLFYLK